MTVQASSVQKEMAYFLEVFGEVQEDDISVDAPSPGFIAPVSVVVHHLLKNLPATYVGNHALDISKIVKSSIDLSMPQVRPILHKHVFQQLFDIR